MKKICCAVLALAIMAAASLRGFADSADKLVVLGDSIASGFGLEGYVSGDNSSAAASFGNLLAKSCGEYENYAVDGRTSAELLAALKSGGVSVSGADRVVISIGGNDFLRPMFAAIQDSVVNNPELAKYFSGESAPDMEKLAAELMTSMITAAQSVDVSASGTNLRGILGEIRRQNSSCEVSVLTVYNPFGGSAMTAMLDGIAEQRLSELNGMIKEAAAEHNAKVADVYSAFKGKSAELTNIARGDIHPNKEGHYVIYQLLASGNLPNANPATGNRDPSPWVFAGALAAALVSAGRKTVADRS